MNAPSSDPKEPTTPAPKRGMRWWIPALIVAAAAANIARLQMSPDLDSMTRNLQTFQTLFVAPILLLVWWLFLTRLRWRVRFAGIAVVVVLGFGLMKLIRMDGMVSGSGKPKIIWSWTPRRSGEVGDFKLAGTVTNLPAPDTAHDSPGYLGRDRTGVATGVQLERDWKAHPPQELWRRPVGLGWPGFAVSGPRAVTQEQRGEDELVVCYDLESGRQNWSHTNLVRFSDSIGGDGPRATPTIAGGRVYALGGTGILDCLDETTGKLLWTHETLKENALPNMPFGKSSSPLVADDLVVVTGGMAKKSTLLAFHCRDGSPAWQAGDDEASFSSPEMVTLAGKRQILSINAASVSAHDPKDGRMLWKYPWTDSQWPKCAQPVVLPGDRVLVSASFSAGCALLQVKAGADGKLAVSEVWKNRNMKSEFSNLVARDGFLYGMDDGILACIDLASGERKWKDGRYGHGQLLLAGDLLLIQTEPGPVVLVEASPTGCHEVARCKALEAKTWNIPALAGDFLLVRNDREAVCFKLPMRVSP